METIVAIVVTAGKCLQLLAAFEDVSTADTSTIMSVKGFNNVVLNLLRIFLRSLVSSQTKSALDSILNAHI